MFVTDGQQQQQQQQLFMVSFSVEVNIVILILSFYQMGTFVLRVEDHSPEAMDEVSRRQNQR